MVAGAEWLASRGIVPVFSVWMPTPSSLTADSKPPGRDYYRQARREFARFYRTYNLNPPGTPHKMSRHFYFPCCILENKRNQ
jgi:hypothetical protein